MGTTWPECEEVAVSDYETLGELMLALKSMPLPVILTAEGGRARHLVRPENRDGVLQGLLIALEHRLEDA